MLAELEEGICELELQVKVARSNARFAEHIENKARNEFQKAQLAEKDIPSESQLDAITRDKQPLQTSFDEFMVKNKVLLEVRHLQGSSDNTEDSQLPEDAPEGHQPGSVAFYIDKAAAQIVEDVKQLKEERATIKKMEESIEQARQLSKLVH